MPAQKVPAASTNCEGATVREQLWGCESDINWPQPIRACFMEIWGANLCFRITQQFCCSFVPFTLLLTPYWRLVWMRYIATITTTWLLAHQKWCKRGVGVIVKEGGGDHWVMWHEHFERCRNLDWIEFRCNACKMHYFHTLSLFFLLLGQDMHL